MGDSQLNSVHLEWPRREAFRRARTSLFDACGEFTQLGIRPGGEESLRNSWTAFPGSEERFPDELEFGLMDAESVYPLKVGINTIGRMPDNDVVIQDPHVSRRHCAIVVHAGSGFEVHDVASKNGTYLNGTRLSGPTALSSGDEIRMCNRQFVFVARPGPNSPGGPHMTLAG